MFYLFIIIFFCALIYFIYVKRIRIKLNTFFEKGFVPTKGPYGVYCFCGKQGKGKTYSVVEFLKDNNDIPIFANIKSIEGINYTYFEGFEELLKLRDKTNCIIVYDEIFTALTKTSKMNTDVLDFLSQMRKRGIIFLTTAQEWLEINITLRRYCRYQIECNMISVFGLFGILIKSFYDAEQMKWSNLDNEYIAPIISTTITKCRLKIANSYDTYEQIGKFNSSKPVTHDEFSNKVGNSLCERVQSLGGHEGENVLLTTTNSNTVVSGQDLTNINSNILVTDQDLDFFDIPILLSDYEE